MNQNDFLKHPMGGLVFRSNALTLEKLASYRVALIVWRNEVACFPLERGLPSSDDVVEKFKADHHSTFCSYSLNLTASGIRQIGKELKEWLCYAYGGLYRESSAKRNQTWMKYFDQLVWRADDYTLDYLKTCHSLLQSDRICEEEKFAIACSYCLETQIEDLWPGVSEKVDNRNGLLRFISPWSLSYWIYRMRNPATSENISNTFDEDDLVENMPLNPWVIEYFWPYLTSNGQTELVFKTVLTKNAPSLKYLLPKLNETLLQRILNQQGSAIMNALIFDPELRSLVLPLWKNVADWFDSRQFVELVTGWLFASEAASLLSHRLCDDEVSLCQQIWACAPNRLKKYVSNLLSTDSSTIGYLKIGASERNRAMRLLKMVLSEVSPQQRANMWRDNWLKFCMHAEKSDMNELIEMYLNDAGERMEFKRKTTMKLDNIQSYCFLLLDHFEFTKLNDFLMFCSINPDMGAELQRSLLRLYFLETSSGRVDAYCRRLDDFVSFIDVSFPNREQNASFKKEFITSRKYLNRFVKWLYYGEFDTIKNLVAAFLSDEQDVREWKEEFSHYCHHFLSTGCIRTFNAAQWQSFMMWCLGSDEKVTEFKRSLHVFDTTQLSENGREIRAWCRSREGMPLSDQRFLSSDHPDNEVHTQLLAYYQELRVEL